jgi:hypothetical protein
MPQQLVDAVHGMNYHAFTATMQASHDPPTLEDPPRTATPFPALTAVHVD